MQQWQRWQRVVRVGHRELIVPIGRRGRVVRVDYARSTTHPVLVAWGYDGRAHAAGRRHVWSTWVPDDAIRTVTV